MNPRAWSGEELVCPGPIHDDSDGDEEQVDSNPGHCIPWWTFPGLFPKCGQAMSQGDAVVDWD